MDRERWRRIEELYQSALERTEGERVAFLRAACGSDSDLYREVESLLKQSSGGAVLDRPAVLGPYEIVERIGAGGMGTVYKARDTRLNRTVAIKITNAEFTGRFEREARAVAAINHPHVCTVHDVGPNYLVMEFVEGETLASRIEKAPLAFPDVIRYGAQVADALAAAHAHGIVHRDLKPANIMLTAAGVKVLDFGLAKFEQAAVMNETITATRTVIGTLAYMSPEQLEGKTADTRSDIFALGMVLYEMATGRKPFHADSQAGLIAEIMRGSPAPITVGPPRFARLVNRCLERNPQRRWQSTADLKIEIEELAADGGRSQEHSERKWRWPAACVAAALAAWCLAGLMHDPADVDLADYRLRPFATGFPVQTSPLWSPDGKSIAFLNDRLSGAVALLSGQRMGRSQLFVQPLDGLTPLAITGPELQVSNPFWSPDSRSLYFNAAGPQPGLYRVAAGGGDAILVQAGVGRSTISPDGRTLVGFVSSESGFRLWYATPPEGPRQMLDVPPVQGWSPMDAPRLAFAPDGRSILLAGYTEERREYWLLSAPPQKGRRRVFEALPDSTAAPQFAWMPDSRHVIFTMTPAGSRRKLFMADVKNGLFWPVLAQDRDAGPASPSPDGTRLAYASGLSHADVAVLPIEGGPVRTILGSFRSEQMPAVSPISEQMVYVADRRGPQELFIAGMTGGWERPLLSGPDVWPAGQAADNFYTPVFAPDGRRVAVTAGNRGKLVIYTMAASGGAPVRATNQPDPFEYGPTWSADGKWLAYYRMGMGKPARLAKVRPASGEPPVDLADATLAPSAPEWSPTGEWIAFLDRTQKLALASPDGKQVRSLGIPGDMVVWSRDGKTLYQLRGSANALVAIDVATGKERVLRDLGDLSIVPRRASLAAGGKEIVFSVNRPREEIWILEGIHPPRPWWSRLWPR